MMCIKAFVEGYKANLDHKYHNPYEEWGCPERQAWGDGWEHARKMRLEKKGWMSTPNLDVDKKVT